ncbi:regulatory protein RecX [Eudoraea sp.]|uniref:regulatory protein RecX n=1 Tax=Eudoraea sp. TaxID=1979955 RepID=UPI003C740332
MKTSNKSYTLEEAKRILESFCVYQDRCHFEVIQKLKDMGMIQASIDHICVHLIKNDFLNEERFARSFARGKFNIKNWGRMKIVSELKKRGIGHHLICLALQEIDEEAYLLKLDHISKKKLNEITDSDINKRKKKLMNFLMYRGWENDLVFASIKRLIG